MQFFFGNKWNMQKICQLLSAIIGTFNLNKTKEKNQCKQVHGILFKKGRSYISLN